MFGWFANAMMAMHDAQAVKTERLLRVLNECPFMFRRAVVVPQPGKSETQIGEWFMDVQDIQKDFNDPDAPETWRPKIGDVFRFPDGNWGAKTIEWTYLGPTANGDGEANGTTGERIWSTNFSELTKKNLIRRPRSR